MVKKRNCCSAKSLMVKKEETVVQLREPYGKKKKLL
jgi:hypothetical protein